MSIKIARIKKGLTQQQLCKKVNISPKKLVDVERGNFNKLTFLNMVKIAEVLGVTVQELFFNEQGVS